MTRSRLLAACCIVAACVLAPAIAAEPAPSTNAQHELVGAQAMTLYTFDTDGGTGHSQCTGPCANVWPPYAASTGAASTAPFSVIVRPDHTLQWAYKGHPLYRYAGDTKPGDHRGDGINGTWHIARAN